jgi:imidazoleglycerol-phosphate dehydratase
MCALASLKRKTKETDIEIRLNLDGSGVYRNRTGIPFLDHMLDLLAKHALLDLHVKCRGDLEVDYHHTVEDVGLALGDALNAALGDRKGINRYGWSLLPMDEALAQVALDLGGRPYLVYSLATKKRKIRDFDVDLMEEFWRAFATQARMNLHIAPPLRAGAAPRAGVRLQGRGQGAAGRLRAQPAHQGRAVEQRERSRKPIGFSVQEFRVRG